MNDSEFRALCVLFLFANAGLWWAGRINILHAVFHHTVETTCEAYVVVRDLAIFADKSCRDYLDHEPVKLQSFTKSEWVILFGILILAIILKWACITHRKMKELQSQLDGRKSHEITSEGISPDKNK